MFDAQTCEEIGVWIELKYGGQVQTQHSRRVWKSDTRTDEDYGQQMLHLRLWEGICRFLNGGGNMRQMAYDLLDSHMVDEMPEMTLPDFFLLSTTFDGEDGEHVYAKRSDPNRVLIWKEDIEAEMASVTELGEYVLDDEELHDQEDLYDQPGPRDEGEDLPKLSGPSSPE